MKPEEPSKKKLVQARLPFQILSPGVKNPVTQLSTPQQVKRKASETELDNEVDCEIAEVKENQLTQIEKKPKVLTSPDKDTSSDQKNDDKKTDPEEPMDVGGKDTEERKPSNTTPANKGKVKTPRSVKTPRNVNKKTKNNVNKVPSSHKRKSSNKKIKTDGPDKSKKTTSTVTEVIDLCDSPCKKGRATEEESSHSPVSPKGNTVAVDNDGERETTPNSEREKAEEGKSSSEVNEEKKDGMTQNIKEQNENTQGNIHELENVDKTSKAGEENTSNSNKLSLQDSVTKQSSKTDVLNNSQTGNSETGKTENEGTNEGIKASESKSAETLNHSQETLSQSSLDDSCVSSNATPSKSNISLSSSECSTPALTPTTNSGKKTFKSPLTTPRRLTPKQLKLREEQKRLREEKEKKKAEEKEEKLKKKQEKEEEKLKVKKEKEEEKRKEKEEKERLKQVELDKKNEEKKLKEEEKKLKEEEKRLKEEEKREEKRAKEEEKRKKEDEEKKKKEEKRTAEEQKEAAKRKSAQAFASFFVKADIKTVTDDEKKVDPEECSFKPFEVKNDMRLAPLVRGDWSEDRRQQLDVVLERGDASQRLYLAELQSPSYLKRSAAKTWPVLDDSEDDCMIIESEKPDENMETESAVVEKKMEKKRQRAKLLQFHENQRPPYWGTWRKRSRLVRPRAPLTQDKTMFEYDIDSDDEWEEPEDGESLRGSEDEESQDEQYEEDNEMFVPHGYLSDEEGQDDLDDMSPEAMKAKLKLLQLEFEAERSEKQEKLKPRVIGCVWFCNSDSDPSTVGSQIAEMFLSRRAVYEGALPLTLAADHPPSPTGELLEASGMPKEKGSKKRLVPDSMLPDIIKKVHGSRRKLQRMVVEIREEQRTEEGVVPSRKCLQDKIREIASWVKPAEGTHSCWFVKEEVLQAHGLTDLSVKPTTPHLPPKTPTAPSTNITKFTKVLTSDERLKLLRESASSPSADNSKGMSTPTKVSTSLTTKTPTIKLHNKPGSIAKKRATLISVPPGQALPKQGPGGLMKFVLNTPKPSLNESADKTTVQESPEPKDKAKKRITPITLTSFVTKSPSLPKPQSPSKSSTASEEIVLSD